MAKPAGPTPERTCPTCCSGLKREVVAISMCSDPWHDGSTPVAPAGAQPPRQHYVEIPANRRVVGVFSDGSYMIEHGDGQREHVYVRRSAKGYQDGLAPVEPTPERPMRGRLERCPDPRCGCRMEHSPDCAASSPTAEGR